MEKILPIAPSSMSIADKQLFSRACLLENLEYIKWPGGDFSRADSFWNYSVAIAIEMRFSANVERKLRRLYGPSSYGHVPIVVAEHNGSLKWFFV